MVEASDPSALLVFGYVALTMHAAYRVARDAKEQEEHKAAKYDRLLIDIVALLAYATITWVYLGMGADVFA